MDKLLVIDDSRDVHTLIRCRLAREAVELHAAYGGDEGVAAAAAVHPDLILLDVEMPGRDGFDVCRALKADDRTMHIPVIFLTGAASSEVTSGESKGTSGAASPSRSPWRSISAPRVRRMSRTRPTTTR